MPTVVSNYQKEEAEEGARRRGGCGRNCLNKCCIEGACLNTPLNFSFHMFPLNYELIVLCFGLIGANLPLYLFKSVSKTETAKVVLEKENSEPPVAFLDSLLLGEVKFCLANDEKKWVLNIYAVRLV